MDLWMVVVWSVIVAALSYRAGKKMSEGDMDDLHEIAMVIANMMDGLQDRISDLEESIGVVSDDDEAVEEA